MASMTVDADKEALRKQMNALRPHLKIAASAWDASVLMAEHFLAAIPIPEHAVVSGYAAIGDEADPAPLIGALRLRHHPIAMPRVVGRGQALSLHLHPEGHPLQQARFGLSEPDADWPTAIPAVLIVPLLAFDDRGYRLGYGAGYYDRTLCALRASHSVIAVGFCYAGQRVGAVPHHDGDETLDFVVTELGTTKFPSVKG